jgi:uncharacterized protein (TIGR03382 family)
MIPLLIAVLAALPAAAGAEIAPIVGTAIDTSNFSATNGVSYINASQCAGVAPTQLGWMLMVAPGGVFTAGGTTRVFASDAAPAVPNGDVLAYCPETSSMTPLLTLAGIVATAAATSLTQNLDVSGNRLVQVTGLSCDLASEGKVIFVCVHWYDQVGNRNGVALGRFIVQLGAPAAPTITSVELGDGALTVSWSAGSGGVPVDHYDVTAITDDARDPVSTHTYASTTGTSLRLVGLVNGVSYDVLVDAYSIGGNATSSDPATGAPEHVASPVNGPRRAVPRSGRAGDGGCSSGPVGVLSLLGAASVLALRRRRR